MDQNRFDTFTKALTTGQSRRALVTGLTGGGLVALLGTIGLGEADAREVTAEHKRRRGHRRRRRSATLPAQPAQPAQPGPAGPSGPAGPAGPAGPSGPAGSSAPLPPPPPECGNDGAACALNADCCQGFSCEDEVCAVNICARTCLAADNFCNVPPANECCGGKSGCRCMTTNNGPFCFGGAGYGGCEGTTAQGEIVPHCEVDADCEAVFGADSGVQCIAPSTFPAGSSCCPGGTQSACILPCPKDA